MPYPTRRVLLAGALATPALTSPAMAQVQDWRSLPRGPQSPMGRPDYPFRARYVIDFWRRAAPGTTAPDDTPSLKAPGRVDRTLAMALEGPVRPTAAQQRVFQRRIEMIRDAFLAQPSLSDLHGGSINFTGRVQTRSSGRDAGRMAVKLQMFHRPIVLSDPGTIQVDGRYHTPTPGLMMQAYINETETLNGKLITTFPYGPNRLHSAPMGHGVHWLDPAIGPLAPLPPGVSDDTNLDVIPKGGDPTIIHFLHAESRSNGPQTALERGELPPTHIGARALAALYMIDWPRLTAQLQAVR